MLDIWTQRSGYNLGTYQERTQLSIPLPISIFNNVNFHLISGKLPPGLRLHGTSIIGSPLEVAKQTVFEFCIRASKNNEISDRTYMITIEGADQPIIVNPEGLLPVGPNETYFILDSSPVEFQITTIDSDVAAGQKLRYFISSGDGALPPGLKMNENGLITGFIDPILSIALTDKNGNFDKAVYDRNGFDYGLKSDNGFDSFKFDTINFDYSLPAIGVKKLNRNYEFIVTVSDGDTLVKRKFRIYVVNEDFLRADNTIMSAGNNTYTAANSGVRAPIWITSPNLGVLRANNYHIIKLDVYNTIDLGTIQYTLEASNPDSSISKLPPGLQLDPTNGELFGIVPYQSEIEETYHFTINASRYGRKTEVSTSFRTFTVRILGEINSEMSWISPEDLGNIDANYVSTLKIQASSILLDADIRYRIVKGELPPGLTLDRNGEIIGKVEQYGNGTDIKGMITFDNSTFSLDGNETSIDRRFEFVARAQDQANYSKIDKKFVLKINTPNDRLYSNIYIKAYMDPFNPTPQSSKRTLFNRFINDQSIFTKEYIYRLDDPNFGVRTDLKAIMYAGIETKRAATYISAIGLNHKKKRFLFGDVKISQAKTPGTMNNIYEIVYVQLIDPLEIDNKKLKPKLKLSKSYTKITVDASNKEWQRAPSYNAPNEPFAPRPKDIVTVDQTSVLSSDPNGQIHYLNTYTNWRNRLRYWKNTDPLNPNVILDQFMTERNYLPLWMRSFQDDTRQELGFVLALPLCYCLPGYAQEIVLNIKNSKFDFKNLDFTVDRYIIDSVIPNLGEQNYGDKYLVFKNNGLIV
jgi:hypothetical protein